MKDIEVFSSKDIASNDSSPIQPSIRAILSDWKISELKLHLTELKRLQDDYLYWPLYECYDMVC